MVKITEQQRRQWGNAIRRARQAKGLTQDELAQEWENTLSYIQKIETGAKGNRHTYRDLIELIDKLPRRRKAS